MNIIKAIISSNLSCILIIIKQIVYLKNNLLNKLVVSKNMLLIRIYRFIAECISFKVLY
jgi:hypothetical protein